MQYPINNLIHAANENGAAWVTCPTETTEQLLDLFHQANASVDVYAVDKMPFEALPESTREKVKETLKAFDKCNVTFERNEFHVNTGYCIRASYHYDYFVCGEYKASEIYTAAERRENFIEVFGYDRGF